MINHFKDDYAWLSNFYVASFLFRGVEYQTVEHFFQAHKTMLPLERTGVIECATPGQAKRAGRKVTLRDDWEEVKDAVMTAGVTLKFNAHPNLQEALRSTGQEVLVEGNYWCDQYWGSCYCRKHRGAPGLNRLGDVLMSYRARLIN